MSTTYLTTEQAAKQLGVTRRCVQHLIVTGELAAVRVGRDWLIRPAALVHAPRRQRGRPKKISENP